MKMANNSVKIYIISNYDSGNKSYCLSFTRELGLQKFFHELEKINEEYCDLFPNIFMELYKKAIEDAPYSFLYLDIQTSPATAYIRFETKIAEGEKKLF